MRRSPFLATSLAVCLALGHLLFLIVHCPPSYPEPDANGYFAQARFLAENGRTYFKPESPLSYIGRHWLETADGRFYSRYPPGVGILTAIPYLFFDPKGGLYLTPILAGLTVLLFFLLCRFHIGGWVALAAALVYAVHPVVNQQALNWGAHTAVTFFLVLGMILLEFWWRSPTVWKAALVGLIFGAIPSLRYAEIVFGIGMALFMLYSVALDRRGRWYDLLAALAGFAVPIGLLMWRNALAFGSPLLTGYGLTGEQQWGTGFSFAFFNSKWRDYVDLLMGPGMGLLCALSLAGLVALCARKRTRCLGILLLGIILPISIVYTAYYFGRGTTDWLRFLLPTLPVFLLAAFCFIDEYGSRPAARAGLVFLILAQIGLWLPETIERTSRTARNLKAIATATGFVRENVPAGAVVIADRRLQENLMYYPDLKLVDAGFLRSALRGSRYGRPPDGSRRKATGRQYPEIDAGGNVKNTNRPQRANPGQYTKADRLRARYDIENQAKRTLRIRADLYDLAGTPPELYWVGRQRDLPHFDGLLEDDDEFVKISELKIRQASSSNSGSGSRNWRRFGDGSVSIAPEAKLELFKAEKKKRGGSTRGLFGTWPACENRTESLYLKSLRYIYLTDS